VCSPLYYVGCWILHVTLSHRPKVVKSLRRFFAGAQNDHKDSLLLTLLHPLKDRLRHFRWLLFANRPFLKLVKSALYIIFIEADLRLILLPLIKLKLELEKTLLFNY
jgi:hypothetical protein